MSRLIKSLVLCGLLAATVGCDGITSSADPANFYTRFTGRILNGDTQQPLSGVTVKVCNFEETTTTDGDGHWAIEIVRGIGTGTYVTITMERSGHGSIGRQIFVSPDSDVFEGSLQNRHLIDLGTEHMFPGVTASALVARDGVPLAGAVVVAVIEGLEFFEDGSGCTDLNIVATTNASGVATLPNVDPTRYYSVWVPAQDLDGNGTLDIYSDSTWMNVSNAGNFVALATETYDPSAGVDWRGTNLASFSGSFNTFTVVGGSGNFGTEFVSFSRAVLTANGSVQVVFHTPVEVTAANFLYRNNLVNIADPDFFMDLRIDATTAALASSNSTIFNFTPLSPLPTNEVVSLTFLATSLVDSDSANNISIDFYVPVLGTPTFGIDNYNGSVDASGGSTAVYLRFSEYVEGFYKVLSYEQDGSTVTFENPFAWSFSSGGHEIINNQDPAPATGSLVLAGAVAGRQYRARLLNQFSSNIFLNDNAATINRVRIEIWARDAEGNEIAGIFDLGVE
jgi:hypothetical protein